MNGRAQPRTPEREPGASFSEAVVCIDAFIRTLRQQRCPTQLLSALDGFFDLQRTLDATARHLVAGQFPPEPLRSNYHARLETLAFELHRLEPMLCQEQTRLDLKLRHSSTLRAWLDALVQTQ